MMSAKRNLLQCSLILLKKQELTLITSTESQNNGDKLSTILPKLVVLTRELTKIATTNNALDGLVMLSLAFKAKDILVEVLSSFHGTTTMVLSPRLSTMT
jgi:hypothetical protein